MDHQEMDEEPGTSKSSVKGGTQGKVNIWQKVDIKGEMVAPQLPQLELNIDGVTVYDQQTLEQGMMEEIDQAFNRRQKTLEVKRATREIKQVQTDIREVKFSIKQAGRTLEIVSIENHDKATKKRLESVKRQKENKEKQLKTLQAKLKRLQKVAGLVDDNPSPEDETLSEDIEKATSSTVSWALTGKDEEEREKLIKLGHMTPFGTMIEEGSRDDGRIPEKTQKRKLALDDGFNKFLSSQKKPVLQKTRKKKQGKKLPQKLDTNFKIPKKKKGNGLKAWLEDTSGDGKSGEKEMIPKMNTADPQVLSDGSDHEYRPDAEEASKMEEDDLDEEELIIENISSDKKRKKQPRYDPDTGEPVFDKSDNAGTSKKVRLKGACRIMDDGKLSNYKKRLEKYRKQVGREIARGMDIPEDKDLGNGFKVPGRVWTKLYKYQKTGVRWLWELHSQKVGGILGDEMGLGKTIQIISFLSGLQQSGLRSRSVPGYGYEGLGPVLIITPTTVMHQWVREFHSWWPPIRVAILHDSGTFDSSRAQLVDNVTQTNGVLVTSYERARINIEMLLEHGWHYVILDEGHKIRNPEAAVTVALKLFRTPHRLILSGSPVQNNLKELWSLFDFIFPGKLGTLPVFMEQFSVPIVQGGYSNATEIQVHTAYKCACKLRDTISPYLLRRMKKDVQLSIELPSKNEQVLFCRLSEHQIQVYKQYLDSDAVHSILTREMKVFAGLIQLRKICNHPDLYTGGPKIMVGEATPSPHDERSFGYYKRSGKMLVVSSLLKIWKKQGHKVLLFSQSKVMIDILEIFASSRGYRFLTMHGGTPVQSRQPLIKQFNEDDSIFVFLLTTRVGGLGVNLTGANRVVIYDPDWNPSTDAQAQERSWRIGQQRDVTIYRLLTSGTIEEKIYHRQIFKQFLTNRVLKDPWQRRFFKSNDLHELFILKDYDDDNTTGSKGGDKNGCKTETAAIFAGTGSEVKIPSVKRKTSERIRNSYKRENKQDKKKETSSPQISIRTEYSKYEQSCNESAPLDKALLPSTPNQASLIPSEASKNDKSKLPHLEANYVSPTQSNASSNSSLKTDKTEDAKIFLKSDHIGIPGSSLKSDHIGIPDGSLESDHIGIPDGSVKSDHIGIPDGSLKSDHIGIPDGPLKSDHFGIPDSSWKTGNVEAGNSILKTGNPETSQNVVPENVERFTKDFEIERDDLTESAIDEPMTGAAADQRSGDKKSSVSFKESLLRAKQKFEQRRKVEENTKKYRKNKRKKKKPVIDGEIVSNLESVEDFKSSKGSAEEIEEKSQRATDDYVLHRLFKRAGVHSALQHNTIMDSAHPDYALVEVEAERVAKESVRNLRRSRSQYQFPSGRQTTNSSKRRFGKKTENEPKKIVDGDDSAVFKAEKGKDKIFKAFHLKSNPDNSDVEEGSSNSNSPVPLSASQLLATMRRRNHEEIHKQEEIDSSQIEEENELFGFSLSQPSGGGLVGSSENPTEHDELMTDLRNYIAFQCQIDGQARTSEIMAEFGNKVEPSHAAVFKSILKQLCNSENSFDTDEKIWRLKPEFR